MIAGATRRFAVFGLLLGAMPAILSTGALGSSAVAQVGGTAPGGAQRSALPRPKISAHLTSTRFITAQANETRLVYEFSRTSPTFVSLLERRQGKKWQTTRSVKRKGSFSGVHSITVKSLFGKRTVEVGRYRLSLSADANRTTLFFRVVGASPLSNAVAVSSGSGHNCALFANGTIDCWGYNSSGELGTGVRTTSSPYAITTAVAVKGITTATSFSAGFLHTCALLAGGGVECWGYNRNGELGNGTATNHSPFAIAAPVRVMGITNATSISSGAFHTCALLQDGSVECWGFNFVGQLGNSSMIDSAAPVQIGGLGNVASISGGGFHTCALLQGGSVECWGDNEFGQLGNGATIDSATPVVVNAIADATSVSAGYSHTCALLRDGTVECWGNNQLGQLGDGTTNSSPSSVKVVGINDAVAISAGGFQTCALLRGGAITCWGENRFGQLGNGTTVASSIPVAVRGVASVVSVSAGYRDTCALVAHGNVKCWGNNDVGQLGNGTTIGSPAPVGVVSVP
jgi:alpha-tubulin suppressor-like RCC1 family protein